MKKQNETFITHNFGEFLNCTACSLDSGTEADLPTTVVALIERSHIIIPVCYY